MYSFFIDPSDIRDGIIYITGSDVNHISHVLRMKAGGKVRVCDRQGQEYLCELHKFEKTCIEAHIVEELKRDVELPSRIVLFQGLPKSDKMELIIQKTVELGVAQIIPVVTKRTIVKLDKKKEENKRKRWSQIAESAAKQSGRTNIPEVHPVVSWTEALDIAERLDRRLMPYELAEGMGTTRQCIEQIEKGQSIGVFIGPEGGFEETEVVQARERGVTPVTLGKRILRTETAGLAMLSILMYHLEGIE